MKGQNIAFMWGCLTEREYMEEMVANCKSDSRMEIRTLRRDEGRGVFCEGEA